MFSVGCITGFVLTSIIVCRQRDERQEEIDYMKWLEEQKKDNGKEQINDSTDTSGTLG